MFSVGWAGIVAQYSTIIAALRAAQDCSWLLYPLPTALTAVTKLAWQVAELKAALAPLTDEQRARFVERFRTDVLAAQDHPESAPGAASSTGAVQLVQSAPRPSMTAPSVQASASLAAPGIPGLGSSPLPRSLQPAVDVHPTVVAGPVKPAHSGTLSNGMPPGAMGGTLGGGRRVSQGGLPPTRPTTAAQPPQRPPSALEMRPALPSPPPRPPPLSPLLTEFEAILVRAPADVLRQHGDRLDKMRAALAEIDLQRGAVLVRSVRDLLLGPSLPGGAQGVAAASHSQTNPLPQGSMQPAAQTRMARDAALQRGAISVPGATLGAGPSANGPLGQPAAANGGANTAQPASLPMRRQPTAAHTATGASAAAPGAAPLGRMARAAGAGQPAPPWASPVSREVAAATTAPAPSGAPQRLQTLGAATQHPAQGATPLHAAHAGVPPAARPPAGLPHALPMVRAGPRPPNLSNGSGPAAAMATADSAEAPYVSTPELLRRLTELAERAAAKLVIKVEQWQMPGRPYNSGWRCTVRWNYEQAAMETDNKKARAQRLAYERALITVTRKLVCQPCPHLPSARGSYATCHAGLLSLSRAKWCASPAIICPARVPRMRLVTPRHDSQSP